MPNKNEVIPTFKTITETTAVVKAPKALKATRKLTLDATSIARLGELVCRIDGEWEEVTTHLGPCKAIPITDILRSTEYLLLCNAMLVSGIERARVRVGDKVDTIVGKFFAIKSGEIDAGKRFRKVEVYQVEVQE